jgi:hypothetical protein
MERQKPLAANVSYVSNEPLCLERKMSKQLKQHGIEVDAYRSPEDDILVIFVDTPEIDEDSKGPLLRLYLNDDPVFENPTYPGAKEERIQPVEIQPVDRFAQLSWCAADVTSLDGWNPDWGDEAAVQFLEQNGKTLQGQLCATGFEIMENLLSDWKPKETDE